jgi:NAD(P)-dependent dehydrogenase (short-subunit alcohol dehydrogenase family)
MTERVVIVTGAAQGIGLETALAFARAGDQVIATSRDPRPLPPEKVDGLPAIARMALDVTDQESVDRLVGQVLDEYGRVDVLVNNAGQGFTGTTEELSIADIQRSLDVNFLGAVRMTKALLPAMRAAGRGHLIAVSSIGGVVGQPFCDAYCAAKHALEGLYESMHPVVAPAGIRVSIIEPGPVDSDHINRSVMLTPSDDAVAALKTRYLEMTAGTFERAQSPAKVAETILACADDAQPKLRYQTSRLVTKIVGMKLNDLDGDAITTMTASWLT